MQSSIVAASYDFSDQGVGYDIDILRIEGVPYYSWYIDDAFQLLNKT